MIHTNEGDTCEWVEKDFKLLSFFWRGRVEVQHNMTCVSFFFFLSHVELFGWSIISHLTVTSGLQPFLVPHLAYSINILVWPKSGRQTITCGRSLIGRTLIAI